MKEADLQLAEWLKREVGSRVEEGILPSIEMTRAGAAVLTARQALIDARALAGKEQEAVAEKRFCSAKDLTTQRCGRRA